MPKNIIGFISITTGYLYFYQKIVVSRRSLMVDTVMLLISLGDISFSELFKNFLLFHLFFILLRQGHFETLSLFARNEVDGRNYDVRRQTGQILTYV